ncbi:TorD/DmsD family molecular chaperone [Dendrosporobacter sp. 1207_IL3150]|uniref:TorD/DmsD family molecular chaperone n=1 Tax=Dendrosporobacter sp. 1207_IL3150 TaxID=3084054 RepID=UPI002FD92782
MSKLNHRIGLYNLFAEFFKEPTAELLNELPDIVGFLQDSFAILHYDIPYERYAHWKLNFADFSELKQSYTESFQYPNTNRIVPVESIYRQWTYDKGAEVAFAKEKGYLMSDAALHMQALYTEFGIEIPDEYVIMPDHICLELEFAALLLEHNAEDSYAVFISEHLTWLKEMSEDAQKKRIPKFYQEVIAVLSQFVDCELKQLEKPQQY